MQKAAAADPANGQFLPPSAAAAGQAGLSFRMMRRGHPLLSLFLTRWDVRSDALS
jgi:hypothetical protein